MRLLAIDTSTAYLSVAVASEKGILSSYHRRAHMSHSSKLIPVVDLVLKKAGMGLGDVDGFALSIGPGSFTGLRIGVTTVKGLALVLEKPVVAVPTLDAIAHNARTFRGIVCPVLDAKKQKVYACLYASDGTRVKRISGYLLIEPDELARRVRSVMSSRGSEALLLGDGVEAYRDALSSCIGLEQTHGARRWHPRASTIASLAFDRFRKKGFSNIFDLVPLYLYSKECDIKGW